MPGPSDRQRWIALAVLCTGVLMIILDTTVVNVALPTIRRDLRFSREGLAWVVNAYLIAFGGLLLLAGRLGDLVGRRRIFLAGLLLFSAASLVCGLAGSPGLLVAARFVQGAGGALTTAVVLGLVVALFPQPAERARAIGVYSFFQAAGGSVGLLLGGVLTQAVSWHWIFFVNVPVGAATALAAVLLVERDTGLGLGQGADVPGGVLLVGALMVGVYAIVGAPALAPVAVVLLAAFVAREARAATPLVPLRVLRARPAAAANAALALMAGGLFAMQFLVPLYLRHALGLGPLAIGLAFLPVPLAIAVLSVGAAGGAIVRFGAAATALPALALIVAGLALLARAPAHGEYARDVLPSMLLLGVGGGLALPALMTLAMGGTTADAGLASGLANTTIQVGGAIGLAALVTLGGFHAGFGGAAALVGAAALTLSVARPASSPGSRGRSARSAPAAPGARTPRRAAPSRSR